MNCATRRVDHIADRRAVGAALAWLATAPSEAHFQLLYTPEAALNESAAIELALVFSHPFDNGYTMDMETPEELYVVSQRGEGEPRKTDLMQYLEPIEWSGVETTAKAFLDFSMPLPSPRFPA